MDAQFFALLDQYHEDDKFNEIIQQVHNIPREKWNYELIGHLVRAYNNANFLDRALELLETYREQGVNDHYWHFRKAYAHYYKNENELALQSFEESLRLRPGDEDTLMFINAIHKENNADEETFPEGSQFIVAQLNARLQPIDRGELFEDHLDEILQEAQIGRVSGGGTMMAENREVAYCDIEINLNEINNETLAFVISQLEKLGAPKGSKINLPNNTAIEFGSTEGLAIYLNGSDLPDDVYKNCDCNHVYSEISRLIDGKGMIMSHHEGNTETAFYLYGESFAILNALIADFVGTYPLCEKCRIVQIA